MSSIHWTVQKIVLCGLIKAEWLYGEGAHIEIIWASLYFRNKMPGAMKRFFLIEMVLIAAKLVFFNVFARL